MDLEFLERLLETFARAPITELDLSVGGWRIRLTREEPARPAVPRAEAMLDIPSETRAPAMPSVEQPAPHAHVVAAGLVGTFHRRPAPDKPPFVAVGDIVVDGQTLGILEAMKMLIGVEADVSGRILEIFKEDGAPVQAGDPLFSIGAAQSE